MYRRPFLTIAVMLSVTCLVHAEELQIEHGYTELPGVGHNHATIYGRLGDKSRQFYGRAFADVGGRTRKGETRNESQGNARSKQAFSWWSVMAVHYRLDTENWMGTTRGWPSHPNIGFAPDVTDLHPENIRPTIGRFSGEPRSYDFDGRVTRSGGSASARQSQAREGAQRADQQRMLGNVSKRFRSLDGDARDALEQRRPFQGRGGRFGTRSPRTTDYHAAVLQAIEKGVDLVWHTGQISAGQPDRVGFLEAKKGAYFKDLLYATYTYFNTGPFKDKPITIYWEIGNEVNSSNRFSLRDLMDGEHVLGHPDHANDYVEYYLAPAVEALRAAAKDLYSDPSRVQILMGSVSGILKPENQKFLDILLNTTIRGVHAPTLAGKKAYEVIDAVVIHYSNGNRYVMQRIFDKWVASGKIRGFWSTEELGRRGRGDYTVALVAFRYLDFMSENGWETMPRGRVTFWGDKQGHPGSKTQGVGAEQLLGQFLQDFPLSNARDEIQMHTRADLEWYAVRADTPSGGRRYAIYAKPYMTAAAALESIAITYHGSELSTGNVVIEAYTLSMDQDNGRVDPQVEETKQGIMITTGSVWEMDITEAVVFLVEFLK